MKPLSMGTGLKDRLRQFDICLLICTSILSIISLLLMYSISDKEGMGLFKMQAAATLVGVLVMVFLSTVDYQEVVNKLWIPFLIAEVGLLGITLLYGVAEGTNQSWLKLGPIYIQPSEFVKGTFIVTFSKHLDLVKHRINHPVSLLGIHLLRLSLAFIYRSVDIQRRREHVYDQYDRCLGLYKQHRSRS